jgi:hypothetical protein
MQVHSRAASVTTFRHGQIDRIEQRIALPNAPVQVGKRLDTTFADVFSQCEPEPQRTEQRRITFQIDAV